MKFNTETWKSINRQHSGGKKVKDNAFLGMCRTVLFRSDFQSVILIKAKSQAMLFPSCLNQAKQSLFLQRKATINQTNQNRGALSPNSKFSQKVSLKTTKSLKSQKSLKTIPNNEDFQPFQGVSLKSINETQRNNSQLSNYDDDLSFFQNPFPETERVLAKNTTVFKTQRRTLDLPNLHIPKICITYQKNQNIRNFSSPDRLVVNNQLLKNAALLKFTELNLKKIQEKRIEEAPCQSQIYSISVAQCINSSLQNISASQKEEDMKSTHIGGQKLQLPLYFPSKPKSTVSMLSERSSCQSVIVDRQFFKNQARINKLL